MNGTFPPSIHSRFFFFLFCVSRRSLNRIPNHWPCTLSRFWSRAKIRNPLAKWNISKKKVALSGRAPTPKKAICLWATTREKMLHISIWKQRKAIMSFSLPLVNIILFRERFSLLSMHFWFLFAAREEEGREIYSVKHGEIMLMATLEHPHIASEVGSIHTIP